VLDVTRLLLTVAFG